MASASSNNSVPLNAGQQSDGHRQPQQAMIPVAKNGREHEQQGGQIECGHAQRIAPYFM
jgi:hypothetical protein